MNCLHCSAPTTNGLALCELVMRKAATDLEFLPVYFRNLARWKPGRSGRRAVPGSRIPAGALGTGDGEDKVIRALDEAMNMLVTRARELEDARQVATPKGDGDADQAAALCLWFARHLTSIATLDWCGDFVRELSQHEEALRSLTEKVAPGWYAGECRRCETPTHVVPGLTWVTCTGCGATTYARDHLDVVLSEARGWVAPPRRMAEAIVALVDTELSVPRLHKRIAKWGERGQIVSHRAIDTDGDEVGPRRYWFGEVLDRLLNEGATRMDEAERIGA